MNDLEINNQSFEDIKHVDENGIEFWYARELMTVLKYNKWENFEKVILTSVSCSKSLMVLTESNRTINYPVMHAT